MLKEVRDHIRYFVWISRGRPIPIDHVFKRKRLRNLGRQYSCQTFVETGTFYGQMVWAVRKFFPLVLSVEISESLYEYNRRKFSNCDNVHLYLGDSAIRMAEMIEKISGRAIFWLDGHYSGPGTVRGETDSPVMAELNGIQKHDRNDHCILIDDAHCFNGSVGWPNISEVLQKLLAINKNYAVTVDHDCIIALPPATGRRQVNT